jgi:hypothetical protein
MDCDRLRHVTRQRFPSKSFDAGSVIVIGVLRVDRYSTSILEMSSRYELAPHTSDSEKHD